MKGELSIGSWLSEEAIQVLDFTLCCNFFLSPPHCFEGELRESDL